MMMKLRIFLHYVLVGHFLQTRQWRKLEIYVKDSMRERRSNLSRLRWYQRWTRGLLKLEKPELNVPSRPKARRWWGK